jgi:hypothetical protein
MATEDEDDVRSAAKSYLSGMPDDDEAPAATDEEGDDDEANEAAKASAFKDLLSALGLKVKNSDKAMEAFTEFLGYCGDKNKD